jgi:hypothetical protein
MENMQNIDKSLYNGRVNIVTPDTKTQFALYDKIPVKVDAFTDALTGNIYNTDLSDAFFSKANIQMIQNQIRHGIYNVSNQQFTIGEQDNDTLKIIMRSIFLQNSLNLKCNIKGQIKTLNQLVLNYCVPQIYGELKGYVKFKEDISTLATPMARPTMTTQTKQLVMKPWF